ncbi:MAG: GNAT family N-acetyltransferase [Mycobacteriales bacterium]
MRHYRAVRRPRRGARRMVEVGLLQPADRTQWEALFRAYIHFYGRAEPDEMYERAWREFQAADRLHALGARLDGRLVAVTHFFIHPSTSGPDVCYLQDLFAAPDMRGRGAGRALISAVATWAQAAGCRRLYWHTHETNSRARRLYDQVAVNAGFIEYEMDLP